MVSVYILFLFSAVLSMFMYGMPKVAVKIGFGLGALSCLYAMFHFLMNINQSESFMLFGSFLFSPSFALTPIGNFFSFVVSFVGFASSVYGMSYSSAYSSKANIAVFACLFNAFLLSMLLVISANNVFSFIVLWEIMTLISSFLILVNDGKDTLKAVMIYLGIAQIGAFCITCGLLTVSYYAQSNDFSTWGVIENMPVWASAIVFVLFLVGFGSKAGMWPFHVWLPLAHPAAPSNVSSLMSGVMIKVALFALIKFSLALPINEFFGITIIILGAASSLFGVLYALTQHDYKSLLAYHSVENIGIILLGIGAGFYGLATANSTLIGLGFLAGLYHILNHATFKGLLFLSAGSVLHATHTKDMEVLGGLAKKMPYTAAFFFIGSMAITALPPLNGFMSEWITYKSLLLGGIDNTILSRIVFALAVVALALTGALAVMCFVKVYGVIFGGTPRDEKIYENAKEQPFFMLVGMAILALGCIGFGLGANSVTGYIMQAVVPIASSNSLSLTPVGGLISTPLVLIVLAFTMLLPFVIFYIMKANRTTPRLTDPWACGFKYSKRMQMTASPFTGDLRKIMNWLFRSEKKIIAKDYFSPVEYHNHAKDIWWELFYEPVIKFCTTVAQKIGAIQSGYTNLYAFYIVVYLCVVLAVGYFVL